MDIDYVADRDLRELSAEEIWEAIEDCAQLAKKMDNPTNVVTDQLIASLREQARSLFGDNRPIDEIPRYMEWFNYTIIQDEHIGNPNTMEDEVDNISPLSAPQVPPSFEVYTPPVTYLEEVEETIGTPIEVEPLDQT